MNANSESFPWLEAVENENDAPRLSARKMLAAIAVVLLAAALVAGTLFWLGRQGRPGASGAPELIRAEPGPYKVKPADPGGLDVAGESGTAYATGAGEETDAELDLSAVAEEPIARTQPQAPQVAEGQPQPVAPAEPIGATGSTIQLGAYENQAQAEAGWTALSGRFPAVAGLNKLVVPYAVNGSTGYRLRAAAASPAEAQRTCQLLKVAGENCFVVR
ncbi:MAG: SPOR domain-containing protein [uncultured Sphingomonas sp.]|uniref:SPOR domain-containing protein n=1 Tax=uncultured Sphingomonas sp. TaxID=158754 RepID=A0A6J4SBR7_9SPHN|nr:SPOR domain-containing protein [uncultured Sphingomonas sp.]CAA9494123.1 MAG: SPOR domain-containing protein [uncultured Sphingomonas sp.]